jgi:hypothetical protein
MNFASSSTTSIPKTFAELAPENRRDGDAEGTRALCEVLLLHRTHTAEQVQAGIVAALSISSIDPGVVKIETRRAIEHSLPTPAVPLERFPNLADYDQLLKESKPQYENRSTRHNRLPCSIRCVS